jgi:RimJ/RimL family protein N-acetyltransferase
MGVAGSADFRQAREPHDRLDVGLLEIHEAGLVLRPWLPDDADVVYRACQDPQLQRWTTVPRPYLYEHAEAFVTSHTAHAWTTGTSAPLGVFDADSGALLGANGLVALDLDHRVGEVGYWVAPWARRRGVATNATRAVARWSLDALGLERVSWRAEIGNHAARLVAERVGFQLEGVLRNGAQRPGDHRVDCWGGALLPGQLLEADAPVNAVSRLRSATFAGPQPRLTTLTPSGATVGLRAPQPRDIEAIIASCRDRESVRWTTIPDPYERTDAEFFVHEHAPGHWVRMQGGVFAIVDSVDAFAGSIDLRLGPTPDVADVGYLVAPWARGRGYASAALRAVCAWGFSSLGLNRIEWRAYLGNDASRRVAVKAGFTVEGLARDGCVQRGRFRDAWTGAILARDVRPSRRTT